MKIYTTAEPVPSRMVAVARLLGVSGTKTKQEIAALLQPSREDTAIQAEKTLDAAVECGLVQRKGTKFELVPGVIPEDVKPERYDSVLPHVMARLLLRKEVNGERNGFAVLCAWLLQLPVERTPSNRGGLKAALIENGIPLDELQIASDLRWDNVIYWARYLGLVSQLRDEPCGGVVPDPTLFVHRHLSSLLQPRVDTAVAEFRSRLGSVCPVLDGGAVREELLARIAPRWQPDCLSDALSFAIERLANAGELRTWCPNDQRTFLVKPNGERIAFLST